MLGWISVTGMFPEVSMHIDEETIISSVPQRIPDINFRKSCSLRILSLGKKNVISQMISRTIIPKGIAKGIPQGQFKRSRSTRTYTLYKLRITYLYIFGSYLSNVTMMI